MSFETHLNPDLMSALARGDRMLYEHDGQLFPYMDEIVLDGSTVELRYRGQWLVRYELDGHRLTGFCRLPISIKTEVTIG